MDRLGQRPLTQDVRRIRVLLGKYGLAQPGGWIPFAAYEALGYNQSAESNVYSASIYRACTIKTWVQSLYVATTNNGSNYWTCALHRISDLAVIASFTTAAESPDTWIRNVESGLDLAVPVSYVGLYVRMTKTGSPGNFYLMGPAIFAP